MPTKPSSPQRGASCGWRRVASLGATLPRAARRLRARSCARGRCPRWRRCHPGNSTDSPRSRCHGGARFPAPRTPLLHPPMVARTLASRQRVSSLLSERGLVPPRQWTGRANRTSLVSKQQRQKQQRTRTPRPCQPMAPPSARLNSCPSNERNRAPPRKPGASPQERATSAPPRERRPSERLPRKLPMLSPLPPRCKHSGAKRVNHAQM